MKGKAYKISQDQESQAYFQKLAADYFRYAMEAI